MRLLIECTYVYDHPNFNSGIQRVVRNIVSKLDKTKDIVDAIPVILRNNKIYEVKRLVPDNFIVYIINRVYAKFFRIRERYLLYYPIILKRRPFCSSRNMTRFFFIFYKCGDMVLQFSVWCISCLFIGDKIHRRIIEFVPKQEDVLVLLDSSWHSNCFPQVEKLKARGTRVVSVIYDLIPLTHPHFCDEGLVLVFEHWFDWITTIADGFIAISKSSRDQVQAFIGKRHLKKKPSYQWYDYFYLGSELDLAKNNDFIQENVKRLFESTVPVYLMVGTVEPRKNHSYLVDAFELLWMRGVDVKLCFVGKIGWKCQSIIDRVKNHPEYNQRLFMFNNLSDAELEHCYQSSRGLVFPAYVEGFGLPLVEAMQRGLPVMASDIPVFREVGKEFIAYFNLSDPESLAALITQFEESGKFPAGKDIKEWAWLTWEDSARQFLEKILRHVKKITESINGSEKTA